MRRGFRHADEGVAVAVAELRPLLRGHVAVLRGFEKTRVRRLVHRHARRIGGGVRFATHGLSLTTND